MLFDPPFHAQPLLGPVHTTQDDAADTVPPRAEWPTFKPGPDRVQVRSASTGDAMWELMQYQAACYWAEQDAKATAAVAPLPRTQTRTLEQVRERNRVAQQNFRMRQRAPNEKAAQALEALHALQAQKRELDAEVSRLQAQILTAKAAWHAACLDKTDNGAAGG